MQISVDFKPTFDIYTGDIRGGMRSINILGMSDTKRTT